MKLKPHKYKYLVGTPLRFFWSSENQKIAEKRREFDGFLTFLGGFSRGRVPTYVTERGSTENSKRRELSPFL